MAPLKFTKMHGLGNDFVVIDLRNQGHYASSLTPAYLQSLADRRTGIGCDQIMVIDPPPSKDVTAGVRIYNQDGSEARACGNGTRCVAALLGRDSPNTPMVLRTCAGDLKAAYRPDGLVTVDMGLVSLEWQDIPLSQPTDTADVPLNLAQMHPKGAAIYAGVNAVAVNVGNPHIVFFVRHADEVDITTLGPMIEHDALFPDRVNVSFAEVIDRQHIKLRVWERGAGATLACGSAACATVVAGHRLGLTDRQAWVKQSGGDLEIHWLENHHVEMTGPAVTTFTGEVGEGLI